MALKVKNNMQKHEQFLHSDIILTNSKCISTTDTEDKSVSVVERIWAYLCPGL